MKIKSTFLALVLLLTTSISAQMKEGNNLAGVSLGFQGQGTSFIYGADYEYILPAAGIGHFGVGGLIGFWGFNEKINDSNSVDYSTAMGGGQINYHFSSIGPGMFVPYAGLVLGFLNVSTKYKSFDNASVVGYEQKYKSGLKIWVQAGGRLFFTPKLAGTLRLGLGNLDFSVVQLGVNYKF